MDNQNPKKVLEDALEKIRDLGLSKTPYFSSFFSKDIPKFEQKDIIMKFRIPQSETTKSDGLTRLETNNQRLWSNLQRFSNDKVLSLLNEDVEEYIDHLDGLCQFIRINAEEKKIFEMFQNIFHRFFLKIISASYRGLMTEGEKDKIFEYIYTLNNYLMSIGVYTEDVEINDLYDSDKHEYIENGFRKTDNPEENDRIYEIRQLAYCLNGKRITRALVCVKSYQNPSFCEVNNCFCYKEMA